MVVDRDYFLAVRRLYFGAEQGARMSVGAFPLRVYPNLHFVNVVPDSTRDKGDLNRAGCLAEDNYVVAVRGARERVLRLSIAGGYDRGRSEGRERSSAQYGVGTPKGRAIRFAFRCHCGEEFFRSDDSFVFAVRYGRGGVTVLLSFRFVRVCRSKRAQSWSLRQLCERHVGFGDFRVMYPHLLNEAPDNGAPRQTSMVSFGYLIFCVGDQGVSRGVLIRARVERVILASVGRCVAVVRCCRARGKDPHSCRFSALKMSN